jgi:hypothetical protein
MKSLLTQDFNQIHKRKNFKIIGEAEEVIETDREIIILGWPRAAHNCDDCGCTSISHVLLRFKKMRSR